MAAEDLFGKPVSANDRANHPQSADFKPRLLATMHGASFSGDGAAALKALSEQYNSRLQAALVG